VLECGGDIGALKFVKWGADWIGVGEFEERLRSSTELAISFDGEFRYDEDEDDVHPKEFRDDFKIADDVALVLKHDGAILKMGNNSWPRSITGKPKWNDSNAAAHAREVIRRVWGENLREEEEERVIGKVGYSEITRRVTVFRADKEDEPP
jgi:hypothetical protein